METKHINKIPLKLKQTKLKQIICILSKKTNFRGKKKLIIIGYAKTGGKIPPSLPTSKISHGIVKCYLGLNLKLRLLQKFSVQLLIVQNGVMHKTHK